MVKKEISSVKNWKEDLWETALCSVNSSHSVTAFPSRILSLRLFLWNLQSDIWNPQRAMVKKEVSSLKTGKKLSEKLLCVLLFHLMSYSFPLQKSLAKTVLVEFAKQNFEAPRGLCWKREYLPLKTEKKLSEKLLCVLLVHLTEFELSPQEAIH